jgi:hypothetical protein
MQNLERKEGQNDDDSCTSQECDKLCLLAWQNMANILPPVRPGSENSTLQAIVIPKVKVWLTSKTDATYCEKS